MSIVGQKIAEIVEKLDPDAQLRLLEVAETLSSGARFYERMTDAQRSELECSRQQAAEGRVISSDELDRQIDQLFAKVK